jgi:hypothetical protein
VQLDDMEDPECKRQVGMTHILTSWG